MEKRDNRHFLQEATPQGSWTIVELESRRQLRYAVNELIQLALSSSLTRYDLQQQLDRDLLRFGVSYALQLVRSLRHDDHNTRQTVVWLLTLLNNPATIPQLQHMAIDTRISRSVRLSASLALAGMDAGSETISDYIHLPLSPGDAQFIVTALLGKMKLALPGEDDAPADLSALVFSPE